MFNAGDVYDDVKWLTLASVFSIHTHVAATEGAWSSFMLAKHKVKEFLKTSGNRNRFHHQWQWNKLQQYQPIGNSPECLEGEFSFLCSARWWYRMYPRTPKEYRELPDRMLNRPISLLKEPVCQLCTSARLQASLHRFAGSCCRIAARQNCDADLCFMTTSTNENEVTQTFEILNLCIVKQRTRLCSIQHFCCCFFVARFYPGAIKSRLKNNELAVKTLCSWTVCSYISEFDSVFSSHSVIRGAFWPELVYCKLCPAARLWGKWWKIKNN